MLVVCLLTNEMIMFDFSKCETSGFGEETGHTEFIYVVCVSVRRCMSGRVFPASLPCPTADCDTQWSLMTQSHFYDTCTVDQEQG